MPKLVFSKTRKVKKVTTTSTIACLQPHVGISQILHEVKLKRQMAQPNLGFMNQLESLYKEGFFQEMADAFFIANQKQP